MNIYTIVYTDNSGDVHCYQLDAESNRHARVKFNDEFQDGVNDILHVILHEAYNPDPPMVEQLRIINLALEVEQLVKAGKGVQLQELLADLIRQ